MEYEAIIGLLAHAQLRTESKLFCGCPARFGDPPNANTCPVCLGLPGALPDLNRKAVELAVRAALGLRCRVDHRSVFARKNCLLPDLPRGAPAAAYERPLGTDGHLEVPTEEGPRKVRIVRIHLEEETGISAHPDSPDSLLHASVDFNCCGVPLVEIATGPDLRTPREARVFLQALRSVLVYLGVSDGCMESGSLRCDASVSVRARGTEGPGTKVEIRSLRSLRMVEKALEEEVHRQAECLRKGERIAAETRVWDERTGATRPLLPLEGEPDHRYFPEPDLLPLDVAPGWEQAIRERLPELPAERRARFVRQYGLPEHEAGMLTLHPSIAGFFEEAARGSANPRAVSGWVMTEVLRALKEFREEPESAIDSLRVRPVHLTALVSLVERGEISDGAAQEVFREMVRTGDEPGRIVERKGLVRTRGDAELRGLVHEVLEENAAVVAEYRAGSEQAFRYLVGQAIEKSGGRASPPRLNGILREFLG